MDLEGMHIDTVRGGGEDYFFYRVRMAGEATEKYGYIYDINNEFVDLDDFGAAYQVAIDVGDDIGPRATQAGDFVTLTYDGAQTLDVCFPEITGYGTTTLYVGADGSTYTDMNLCLLAQSAPAPTETATPAPVHFGVNYQPTSAPTPSGYFYMDTGAPYGTHQGPQGEWDYGWY